MCNIGLNDNHKQVSNKVNHHFSHWIEVHDIIHTDLNYTFSAQSTNDQYKARLDRIYTKLGTTQQILDYKIIPTTHSDHEQLLLKLKWGDRPTWGKGTWKLNAEILKNPEFIKLFKRLVEIHEATKLSYNCMAAWDKLKRNIKSIAMRVSQQNSAKLKQDLLNINVTLETDPSNQTHVRKRAQIITEIKAIEFKEREGNRIRSKEEKFK